MPQFLEWLIIAAHFLSFPVIALNIWTFYHHSHFYKTKLKLRSLPLIYLGFVCIGIGAGCEIVEHIGDNWFYVSRLSQLNLLFYLFVFGGSNLIALGLKRSRITDIILIASMILVPITYGAQGGKKIMQFAQLPLSTIFLLNWYWVMRDWRVFLYPLFANIATVGFGIVLIVTGNQVFHVFIGPSSALGLLILAYVTWTKPIKMQRNLKK